MNFFRQLAFFGLAILGTLQISQANAQARTGNIQGIVTDALSNEALIGVTIQLVGTEYGTITEVDGKYEITELPPGLYNVQARYVGYTPQTIVEIEVNSAKPAVVVFKLDQASDSTKEVLITTAVFNRSAESPVSLRQIGVSEIQRNPGGNRDISRAVQSLPGVASGVAFRNDIIIRGGSPGENRFYLDGVEVPTINHFATQGAGGGPVGLINVDLIKEVNFYSGAYPSNRGNTLSSVFEFNQKDARTDRVGFRGILGSSDVALLAEGPAGKNATFLVSARRSYLQFLFQVIGLPFLPTYNDFQTRYRIKFGQKHELSFIGLGAIDQFALNLEADTTNENRYILGNIPKNSQWNYTNGLVYKYYRQNGFMTAVLSRNMLNNEATKYTNNDESSEDNLAFRFKSQESENKLRLEYTTRTNGYRINYGINAEYARYLLENTAQIVLPSGVLYRLEQSDVLKTYLYGIFGQISHGYLEERLQLSLGLRTDGNNHNASMRNPLNQLSPRLSASYNLTPEWSLNGNVGIYYQRPSYTVLGYRDSLGRLDNIDRGVTYLRNQQAVLGIAYTSSKSYRISVEGFYKLYDNYPMLVNSGISLANEGADFGVVGNEAVTSTSEGRAYGVEFLAQQRFFKGFYGIAAVTLVRSEFTNVAGEYKPASWDNRYIIAITAGKQFKKGWELGLRYRAQGGSPFTPFDSVVSLQRNAWDVNGQGVRDFTQLNGSRTGFFNALDIRVDKKFAVSKRSFLDFYIDIQNVTGHVTEGGSFVDVVRDEQGNAVVNPNDPSRYLGTQVRNVSGNRLPTIGVIFDF